MTIYRLEHAISTLGPFEHHDEHYMQHLLIPDGIRATRHVMDDIDQYPEIKDILSQYQEDVRFGFSTADSFLNMIKNKKLIAQYGFVLLIIDAPVIFTSHDNQVIYLESQVREKIQF